MKTTPVKGTYDYSPRETAIRDYLQDTILKVYRRYGYERILTPALEDAENIDKSDAGDNLNLVFHIMKRGDKLTKALAGGNEKDLADLGLRYDLTLPLSRYVANNQGHLVLPFKVIQIGNVYRAERPQKGRLREFVQCDIDVMGSNSPWIEVELLYVAAQALAEIGLKAFRIHVNDRRVLRSLLLGMGFLEDQLDSVSISFDKLDKIGPEGVSHELREKDFPESAIASLEENLASGSLDLAAIKEKVTDKAVLANLDTILTKSQELAQDLCQARPGLDYSVVFDPSLVRGQGYYTGTVFEIRSDEFRGSIGGGGRYDNLVGKFIKQDIPAVGISIGFERIFSILMESDYHIPGEKPTVVLFYQEEDFMAAFHKGESLRDEFNLRLMERPKKLPPVLDKLKEQGVVGFINFPMSETVSYLE